MKRKNVALISMCTMAMLAFTACGSNTQAVSGDDSKEAANIVSSKEMEDEELEKLPYTVEIVYPDEDFKSMTQEEFNAKTAGNYSCPSYPTRYPYVTITNTSDEAYALTYDETIYSCVTDEYFEPGEVVFCTPHLNIDESGIYTWAEPEQIMTGSINQYSQGYDTIHGSSTIVYATDLKEGTNNRFYCKLPVIRNPYTKCITVSHINFYDAKGNIVATDGFYDYGGAANTGMELQGFTTLGETIPPTIRNIATKEYTPKKYLVWDHAEVFWQYKLPDNSAG